MKSRFDTLKDALAKKPGVSNPAALAASIGRKKYGQAAMTKMSSEGKRRAGTA